jgi:glutamate-1-semialdehyde 2,1-aminomutase
MRICREPEAKERIRAVGNVEMKFRKRTPKSAELTERAAKVLPGGETRSAVYHPPYSVVVDRGTGPRVWDIDGNDYLDLSNNYTCLVHGHAYAPVIEAAMNAAHRGSTYAAKTLSQIELAEAIVERINSVDEVRYANSGAEAVQVALLIARGYNGRSKILISNYGYHGHFIDVHRYLSQGSPATDFVGTYIGEWDNPESFEKILAEHGDEITAVLLEPWLGAGGMVGASKEFFNRVQVAAKAVGALFIFDEATVQRLSVGGAQSLLGIEPDLTVLGKLIGGGFPCGGVGGRREFMELLNPKSGNVHVSGTFSGNPVTTAAGNVAVRELTQPKIDKMATQLELIDLAMAKSAAGHGIPYSSRRIGSLMNVWFSETLPASNHVRQDEAAATLFHLACMANGLFAVPRTLVNISTATTDADVVEIISRLDATFADMAAEI